MIKAYIPQAPDGGLYPCFIWHDATIVKIEIARFYGCSWSTLKRRGYKLLHLTPAKKRANIAHVQQLNTRKTSKTGAKPKL